MFTQVRTHFTVNTPRLIVHTCSEDCSEVTKYLFCPPLKNFLIFVAESEIRGLPAGKGPTNRERNLGWDHTRQIAFCVDAKSSPVSYEHLTDMWLFTLRDPRGAASLVTEIAPKSPFLLVNRSLIRYGFCAGGKAIGFCVNKRQTGRRKTKYSKNFENRPVIPDGWRHQACHAYRIFFTKSIVCLYLDSSWHLLQVCWRRKAFLARFGKEGSLAGKCICRNVRKHGIQL